MKHTQEEIINSLKVIKDECDARDDGYCMKCTLQRRTNTVYCT